MASYTLNADAVARAEQLIRARQYVLDSDWGDAQPKAEQVEPTALAARSRKAWARAGLDPIGLHDARHAAASMLIAAGVNVKALSTYMGHASVAITLDLHGHLFPGSENEAARLVDSYLESRQGTAEIARG